MNRSSAKVVISPIQHFVGSRPTRQTWQAALVEKADDAVRISCEHDHGHRTVETAKACGVAMWRKLPAASEVTP